MSEASWTWASYLGHAMVAFTDAAPGSDDFDQRLLELLEARDAWEAAGRPSEGMVLSTLAASD